MALYPYQGLLPLGQFDVLDSYAALINGGEIGTVFPAVRANSATEKAAYDVLDGYTNATDVRRVGVAPRVNTTGARPLWLLDEGTAGYGVLFGSVIGSPVGLSTTGTNLGPHTMSGSGKVTCWSVPGIYAISIDAVDDSADGLVLTNANCDPGGLIQPQLDGVLTISTSGTAVAVTVGQFMEFDTKPFLVTTPASLIGATESAVRVVMYYNVSNA